MNDDNTTGDEHTRPKLSLSTVVTGVEGGLFATIVMTVFREPTARALPPPAELLAQRFGGDRDDYYVTSLALHLLYGIGGGALFAPLLATMHDEGYPEATGLVVRRRIWTRPFGLRRAGDAPLAPRYGPRCQ